MKRHSSLTSVLFSFFPSVQAMVIQDVTSKGSNRCYVFKIKTWNYFTVQRHPFLLLSVWSVWKLTTWEEWVSATIMPPDEFQCVCVFPYPIGSMGLGLVYLPTNWQNKSKIHVGKYIYLYTHNFRMDPMGYQQNIWMFPKMMVPPKSPILIRFSIINHPFWGTSISGNTHIEAYPGHFDIKPSASRGLLGMKLPDRPRCCRVPWGPWWNGWWGNILVP